jgi:hypothetical protein
MGFSPMAVVQQVHNRQVTWIRRRNLYGASNVLLKRDVRHLRMSPEKFDELLAMIEPSIRKKDTAMRSTVQLHAVEL